MIIYESPLTAFEASVIFEVSWAVLKIGSIDHKTKPIKKSLSKLGKLV